MGDEMKHEMDTEQKAPLIGKKMLGLLLIVAIVAGTITVVVYLRDSEPIPTVTQFPGEIVIWFMPGINQSAAGELVNETGGEVISWQETITRINNTQHTLIVAQLHVGEGNETNFIELYEALPEVFDVGTHEGGVTG